MCHIPRPQSEICAGKERIFFPDLEMHRCQCCPTILCNEGVVCGIEGEEPIPVGVESEQHGRSAERAGEPGGPHGRPGGGFADNSNVLECSDSGCSGDDPGGEAQALVVGRVGGEVEHVPVTRVVDREEEPEEAAPVAARAD